jgi:PKD repeat protein
MALMFMLTGAAAASTNTYYVVSGNPSAASPFDTWDNAAADIQTAVDRASADLVPGVTECEVLVSNGTYTLTSQITITNAITVRSLNGRDETFIDGNFPACSNRCMEIRSSVAMAVVDGFTITNGFTLLNMGGGVYVASNGQAAVLNCTISRNRSYAHGGGMAAYYAPNVLVTNCIISFNTNAVSSVGHGGGVYCYQSKGRITDCTIVSNANSTASGGWVYGGGVYSEGGNTILSNCAVSYNWAKTGGGIYLVGAGTITCCLINHNVTTTSAGGVQLYNANATLTHSTIASNRSSNGGGVNMNSGGSVFNCEFLGNVATGAGGGLNNSVGRVRNCLFAGNQSGGNGGGVNTDVELLNCTIVRNQSGASGGGLYVISAAAPVTNVIVYGNSAGTSNDVGGFAGALGHSCSPDLVAGVKSNLTADPLFLDAGSGFGTNAVLGDYALQTNSPCIGAGLNLSWMTTNPAVDLAGNHRIRPAWGAVDMGAYEAYLAAGSLTDGFSAAPTAGASPLQVVFTGETSGNTNGLVWQWIFGDGATSDWSPDVPAMHTYVARTNAYTVTVNVTNAAGEMATAVMADYIRVYPPIAYVSTNGAHQAPFESWETAATNIQAAVDVAGAGFTTVLVSNGTYVLNTQVTISNGITLRSLNGRDVTVIDGNYPVVTNRCIEMTGAGAVLDGFTVSNGFLSVGTPLYGAGVKVTGGMIGNCIITGNRMAITGSAAEQGVGVYASGAMVSNCVISLNTGTGSSASRGGGVYALGASKVTNCQIVSNQLRTAGGIYLTGLSTGTACAITYNYANAAGGAGGGMTLDAVLEDCLVFGNESGAAVGGISCTRENDVVRHCTIVGNKAVSGPGGLYLAAGYVPFAVDTIVWGNLAGSVRSDIGGATDHASFSCSPDLTNGVNGNTSADPQFVAYGSGFGTNAMPGDYHLLAGSSAIDTASTNGPDHDLEGVSRPFDGDGDGLVGYDMGAYEALPVTEGGFRCSFTTPTNIALDALTAVLTAHVAGTNTNNLAYFWIFGDGATSTWSSATREVLHSYGYGAFDVTLIVSNELGEVATRTRSGFVAVYPSYVHVATNGGSVSPFATWETAATNLQEAIDTAAIGEGYTLAVLVSNGVYTVTNELTIDKAVTLRGFSGNWDDTVIRGGYPASTNRCVTISGAGAVVDGFTITNGNAYLSSGGGINMTAAATVRNCLIAGNTTVSTSAGIGGGIAATAGSIIHCTVRNNVSTASAGGGGIYASGAGVVVSDCLVTGNRATLATGGGIRLDAGLVTDCIISNNVAGTSGGGISKANTGGATNRNSLIAGNQAANLGGGVYMSTGMTLQNCTVVGNLAANGGGICLAVGGLVGMNCVVAANQASSIGGTNDIGGTATSFSFSCSPDLVNGVNSNTTANPGFVKAGSGYGTSWLAGDYRLRVGSPCVDTGTNLAWMASAADLEGKPRILGAGPNMGAYEKPAAVRGSTLQVR